MTLRWMPAAAFGGKFKAPAATFVVVHCTESDNNAGTAESLAGPNWFGGAAAGTSAHRMFDRDSGVEMVRPSNVAYHAGPGGNTWGRSYEFCGRAAWTAAKWREPEQLAALKLAAPYMAQDLIEITGSKKAALTACRWLSVVQVAAKAHGLCTHNDIRLALGGTTHSDPGPNFPYSELLGYVRASLTNTPVEDDDMPTAAEIADAVWTRRIKTPDSVTTAETILANVEGYYNHSVQAIVTALLDAQIDRKDLGRGPTSLRAVLTWSDNHVDALASGIAAAVSAAQAGSIAGPVDAAAVQRAVQDAVNNLTVKISAS